MKQSLSADFADRRVVARSASLFRCEQDLQAMLLLTVLVEWSLQMM